MAMHPLKMPTLLNKRINMIERTLLLEMLIKYINDYVDETNEPHARITSDDINRMRNSSKKFSKEINKFIHSNTHKSLKKPLLAKHLANNTNEENVDENIHKLFELI